MFWQFMILAGVVFGLNLVPAFMPPTWMVLAYFGLRWHLPLAVTVAVGASFATLGRVGLSAISRKYFRTRLPRSLQESYEDMGKQLLDRGKLFLPLLVMLYAFSPIPSNQVFLTIGLANMKPGLVAWSFFFGRLMSYTFWVSLTRIAATSMPLFFERHFANPWNYVIDIAGFALIYLAGEIYRKKRIKRRLSS